MLFSLFLVTFSQQAPILCVYSYLVVLQWLHPWAHFTIKYNSIKFNSLGFTVLP